MNSINPIWLTGNQIFRTECDFVLNSFRWWIRLFSQSTDSVNRARCRVACSIHNHFELWFAEGTINNNHPNVNRLALHNPVLPAAFPNTSESVVKSPLLAYLPRSIIIEFICDIRFFNQRPAAEFWHILQADISGGGNGSSLLTYW